MGTQVPGAEETFPGGIVKGTHFDCRGNTQTAKREVPDRLYD